MPADFWTDADELVHTHRVVLDRPRNTPHPKAPQHIYPLDYGYLEGTSSGDGAGIDVWIGTGPDRRIVGLICTIDLRKRDMEVKLLLDARPPRSRRCGSSLRAWGWVITWCCGIEGAGSFLAPSLGSKAL